MAIKVLKVFKKYKQYLYEYTTTDMSLMDVKANSDINIKYYAMVSSTIHKNGVYINLSVVLLETICGQQNTWEAFTNSLTDTIIESYIVNVQGLSIDESLIKNIKNISPLGCVELSVGYCDHRTPGDRNSFIRRWNMPDLVISKLTNKIHSTAQFPINLNNCIVSSNGIVSKPILFENELYILDGAKNMWASSRDNKTNLFMFDTSDLGGHSIMTFPECTHKVKSRKPKISYFTDIEIMFPEHIDLSTKTLLMCLGGRLYFQDEIKIVSKRSILLEPFKTPLYQSVLMLYTSQAKFVKNTSIVITEDTVSSYLESAITTNTNHNFFMLIDNPAVTITRDIITPEFRNFTNISKNAPGILVQKKTGAIIDYTVQTHSNIITYYSCPPQSMNHINVWGNEHNQIGFTRTRCDHITDVVTNYNDSRYEFVHLTS